MTNAERRLIKLCLLPEENVDSKKENGTWGAGPAAQNETYLWHRKRTGTRWARGQWDGHGDLHEDSTESNIETPIEAIHKWLVWKSTQIVLVDLQRIRGN
jgi:hypothetical protein